MNDTYEDKRRLFEAAYQNVIDEQPSRETAMRERAAIVARLQVQAMHLRVKEVERPILNGRAAAYAAVIDQEDHV